MAEQHEIFESKLEQLKTLLHESKRTIALTGAGVSTLSGIPDFRSSGGVYSSKWKGYDVEEVLSISFFRRHPELFYEWGREFLYQLESSEPSVIHTLLATLEQKGYLSGLFTQNIDMLHFKAGSKKHWEVHGSAQHHYCTNCTQHYPYEKIAPVVRSGDVPLCTKCQHVIRPDIVFYGEGLDSTILSRAVSMFREADLCIVLGSSLIVQPVATLPAYTLGTGGVLTIVNKQRTPFDDEATLLFSDLGQFGEALLPWAHSLAKRDGLRLKP